jgi:hypothetical protein
MSEQNESDAVETTTPDADESTEQAPKPTETVDFWKSKAREQEKRAKENANAAKELAAIRDADKTELQRERDAREAAQREAAELRAAREVDDWKAKVSKKSGIPADVLRGSTLEDIEDHAASLKALLPEPRTPGHVPSEGRTVTGGAGNPAQQFASILKQQLAP